MDELKTFELDLRVEGITRDRADILLMTIQTIVESWDATVAGGIVEVEVEDGEEA